MQVPQTRFLYTTPNKFVQTNNFQKPPTNFFPGHRPPHMQTTQAIEFDGKRLRKAVTRKTVDYNSAIIKYIEARVWQRDYRDRRAVQPDPAYYTEITPPLSMPDNPINAVTTKFVRTSTNKMRCPIFCVAWTPEGRRLVTGASSGEFTLWNGLTFNFETILQAHDSPVRCMVWSHNDVWMVTGDHSGYVKYWQSNMNNVKMFQAHKEPLRGISFCPIDNKFATCSDDGTVRIWDFLKCFEEKILRGHGADVKCVDWHPQKSLIVSGSKDSQQPIKLWDPKSGQSLATIHAHKNTVMEAKWNRNGNWLLTASRDHLLKLFDIRNMSQEMQTFRGHKKEATSLAWHPVHEGLFTSGGSDGSVMFWVVGADKEVGSMEQAHDSCVWSLAWHPLGHILCSGSNDHTSKFWTRNRPGDRMRDKYNLNTLPKGQEESAEYDDSGVVSSIPGMGLEYGLPDHLKPQDHRFEEEITVIPGLDFTSEESANEKTQVQKKVPFSKPIPKQFQQQWMESKQPLLLAPPTESAANNAEPQPTVNNDQQLMQNNVPPPILAPPPLPPDQQMQFPFPPGMGGNPLIPTPNVPYSTPSQEVNKPPQRAPLLGDRPAEPNPVSIGPPSENYMNMPKPNLPFGDSDERAFVHNPPVQNRNEDVQNDGWRSYGEPPPGGEMHDKHFPPENSMHPPHVNNANCPPPPPPMRQSEFYPNHNFNEPEKFPPDMAGRTGHGPPHFDKDLRYQRTDDPRSHLPNNHHVGPPEESEFDSRKRPWQEGPGSENHFPVEPPMHEFNENHPMHNYGPRPPMRHGGGPPPPPPPPPPPLPPFYGGGRGHRGMYRGRSPYRIVNHRGRGRGGYME